MSATLSTPVNQETFVTVITPIASITEANRAVRRYLVIGEDTLPADTFDKLEKLADSPSPVDVIVGAAELLYARSTEIDDAGRVLIAQLASFAAINGWHGLATDNRGGRIAQAMARELGVEPPAGTDWPVADTDPTPKREMVRADPVDEPAAEG